MPKLGPCKSTPKILITDDHANEIERYVRECVAQVQEHQLLVHYQRIALFRAIIAYLFDRLNCLETQIHCFTVHAMAQLLVDAELAAAKGETTVDLELESMAESIKRDHTYKIPFWLVEGLKAYFLAVRPHFLPKKAMDAEDFTRRFEDKLPVLTNLLFVNSNGKSNFRIATVALQHKTAVRWPIQLPFDMRISLRYANYPLICTLPFDMRISLRYANWPFYM